VSWMTASSLGGPVESSVKLMRARVGIGDAVSFGRLTAAPRLPSGEAAAGVPIAREDASVSEHRECRVEMGNKNAVNGRRNGQKE